MRRALLATSVYLVCCGTVASAASPESLDHFESAVRPILVNRCYECHDAETGPDAANLRLDSRHGWMTGGDSGPAVNVDQPQASLLLRAISYDDPDLQMPPRSKLPDREIEVLRAWIATGAAGPDQTPPAGGATLSFDLSARRAAHWAWQPVRRPEPPPVEHPEWCRDQADRFVLARLEAAGLLPAGEADRATWLRRVTYDLTGLPPTVAEIEVFQSDSTPGARARVVDRLLASQAFGEHWGQHWLDLVRYAESKGHEQDYSIAYAWRYRDYVIRAFNANLPYDQFLVEQIAGDLVAPPRIDPETKTNQSIQGTGWWHLGEATHSPVDIRGEEADRINNQLDVFGKAFLGMTVACARCHDHKFDAISTEDYYALCGFIQSSSYQEANIADPPTRQRVAQQLAELNHTAAEQLVRLYAESTKQRLQQLLSESGNVSNDNARPLFDALSLQAGESADAPDDRLVVDFSQRPLAPDDWITSGYAFAAGPSKVGQVIVSAEPAGPPFRVVEHGSATNAATSPAVTGLYRTRTFAVTAPKLWYRFRGTAEVFLDVDSHRTVAGPLHGVCIQRLSSPGGWQWFAHDVSDYVGHRVHVDFKPAGEFALAEVRQAAEQPADKAAPPTETYPVSIGADASDNDDALRRLVATLSAAVDSVVAGQATNHDAVVVNWLLAHDECLPPAAAEVREQLAAARSQYCQRRQALEAQLPEPQYALALLDGSGEDEYVHLRGSHKRLAPEPTPRRFLTALGGAFPIAEGSGRLELAHRVASPDNPLTARVAVNRVWAHLLGQGIVPTVDNLGVLGQPPTHPELLDYLASEFIDSHWDTKALVRRIVLSSTYGQASCPAAELDAEAIAVADPANNLIHQSRVRRLPAEAIRDALFAISGQLDSTPNGPSVPIYVTDFMRNNRTPPGSGPMDGGRRRSIYVEVRRNAFNHFLAAFDKPAPFTTVGHRNQSNSAAQPLMLLNDPLVHQLVARWAERLTDEFADDQPAIQQAYRAAFARPPTPDEHRQLLAFLAECNRAGMTRPAAWQDVCLALVNSKEFVFLQ